MYTQNKNNEKYDGISRKRRCCRLFSQCPGSVTYPYHLTRNGPHTTSNKHAKLKFHHKRHYKQYSAPKTIKSHGCALLLDSISNQTKPFPCILETRHVKPGIFFYQTSPIALPQINAANMPPFRGYRRESFYKGVFITCSYRKAR